MEKIEGFEEYGDIYKQTGSKNYYIKLKTYPDNGKRAKYIQKSLGTSDLGEAKRIAIEKFIIPYKASKESSLIVSNIFKASTSVAKACYEAAEFVEEKRTSKNRIRHANLLKNEIAPYFKNTSVKDLNEYRIEDYFIELGPMGETTLRNRQKAMRELIHWCKRKGYIEKHLAPELGVLEILCHSTKLLKKRNDTLWINHLI